MSGLAVPFPRIGFSARIAWAVHMQKNVSKGQGPAVKREETLSSLSKRKPPVLLSATLHVPVKSPPTRSASPPYRRVFVKRLLWANSRFCASHPHWRSLLFDNDQNHTCGIGARHVEFSKIGSQPASLDYQLRVNTRITSRPLRLTHLLNAVSVEAPLEFD